MILGVLLKNIPNWKYFRWIFFISQAEYCFLLSNGEYSSSAPSKGDNYSILAAELIITCNSTLIFFPSAIKTSKISSSRFISRYVETETQIKNLLSLVYFRNYCTFFMNFVTWIRFQFQILISFPHLKLLSVFLLILTQKERNIHTFLLNVDDSSEYSRKSRIYKMWRRNFISSYPIIPNYFLE